MKVILIYSGKGGVGKTTTTVNLAKIYLEQGKKVAILDGDINTPSIPVYFPKDKTVENLSVYSTGYEFESGMIYMEKSLIRKFIGKSIDDILKNQPDILLVDTPPSITDVHINLIEKLKVSGVLIVTQPTELSRSDVKRTGIFFQNRNIDIIGIVENMCYDNNTIDYIWKTIGRIPFAESFSGEKALESNKDIYSEIANTLLNVDAVVLENKKRFLFDETITYESIEEDFRASGKWGEAKRKELKFINLSSWSKVREGLLYDDINFTTPFRDRLLDESTFERVERLVKAFEDDEESYFMVINSPSTEIKLITGEIGQCSMVMKPSHYNLPCVKYKTKLGEVVLFPHEVMPISAKQINDFIADGYHLLPDGRYMPPKESVEELYNTFGSRVGLLSNWENEYDKVVTTH